jgi:hypothetical protein
VNDFSPKILHAKPPTEILILPWNIATEIKAQFADLAEKGTNFVNLR